MRLQISSWLRSHKHYLGASTTYILLLSLPFMVGLTGDSTWASTQSEAASQTSQPTTITIGTTIQRPAVKRFGINISGQSFYDSGQMLRNLTFRNPGFEGESWQSILVCHSASAHTCTGDNQWNQWPADFLKGAQFEFIYGQANGQKGVVAGMGAASTSSNTGITVDFGSLGQPPAAGDYYIVRMNKPGNAQAGWWPNTSGGGALTTEFADLSPKSPGKQALRMSASGNGQSASVTSYFDTLNGRSFVQMKGRYTLSFRAKGLGGANRLDVGMVRLAAGPGNKGYLHQSASLSSNWQDYSYSFNVSENGNAIGPVSVSFSVSGASALLDDVALTEAPAPDNPTAFRNAVVERLRELRPGVLRYMDNGTDFGSSIANMLAVPFGRMRAGNSERIAEQDDIPIGFHEFIVLCQAVGAEPWLTVPAVSSPAEMQDLIEYLGGDSSTHYGAVRTALGQPAPWTTVFPVIHLEFGNETWNVISFPGAKMNDPVAYAKRTSVLFAAAKASPAYAAGKFDLIMDGWAAVPWWNQQELASANDVDTIDVAPYLFSNLSDFSSKESIFGPMFAQPEFVDSTAGGIMMQQAKTAASAPKPVKLAVYEVNLGTAQGTAPQSMLDAVIPSVGAGIAVADHMFTMLRDDGVVIQNLFALPEYENGFTNTANGSAKENMKLWGAVVDMGGQSNASRPQFLAEKLANTALFGSLLKTEQTGGNPTWNQAKSANDGIALQHAHFLQSFAFAQGTKHSLVIFNLHRSQALPVNFSGINAPSGHVEMQQLTSGSITDTNEQHAVVSIKTALNGSFNPKSSLFLPSYSMTVLTWSTGQ